MAQRFSSARRALAGHNHAEAFCLMKYRCQKCGHGEVIWNSRDGVTPFTVGCPECPDAMVHVDFASDRYSPDHKPRNGDLVFVTLGRAGAAIVAEAMWCRHPDYYEGLFASRAKAIRFLLGQVVGEPHLTRTGPKGALAPVCVVE